jgi:hypothetical protein
MAGLIVGALAGAAKDELLAPRYSPVLRPVGGAAARPQGRRGRGRLVPPPGAARDRGQRLRRPFSRGRPVGLRPRLELPGGGAPGAEPRRRRRHDRGGLRAARGRPLRRGGDPCRVEVEARAPRDDRGARRPAARRRPRLAHPAGGLWVDHLRTGESSPPTRQAGGHWFEPSTAHSGPARHAETAWLSGPVVRSRRENAVPCCPRCCPRVSPRQATRAEKVRDRMRVAGLLELCQPIDRLMGCQEQ